MKQLEGFVQAGFEDHICKLVHTIYGTMQGAHDWYETITNTYEKLEYTTSRADPCYTVQGQGRARAGLFLLAPTLALHI